MKIIPRNYGSIPHLSTSKMTQQADKKIESGQEVILTKKARDWRDLIIVTEKIDGSNVGVVQKYGNPQPITRAGYLATTSPYRQHHYFAQYVAQKLRMFTWLPDGWRICGEWCIQAHGTLMDITDFEPFVAFDIFDARNARIPYVAFQAMCYKHGIITTPLLHIGQPIGIKNAIKLMGNGRYGAPEKPEGCVWRCERDGNVEFLAKWVRADKEDGRYMDKEIWNKGAEFYTGAEHE